MPRPRPQGAAVTLSPALRHRLVDAGILVVVGVSMVVGVLAGLSRIGYAAPAAVADRAALHGPILAAGVLGTLIALERAVAFTAATGRRLHPAYVAPVASAVGTAGIVVAGAVTLWNTQGACRVRLLGWTGDSLAPAPRR